MGLTVLREWLIDRQGLHVVDMPAGFGWGRGERDSTVFSLVRMELSEAQAAGVRARKQKMVGLSGQVEGNLYTGATLAAAAAGDELVIGRRNLNLRTGRTDLNDEDALANAQAGDYIFQHKHNALLDDSLGFLVRVEDDDPPRLSPLGERSFKEVSG